MAGRRRVAVWLFLALSIFYVGITRGHFVSTDEVGVYLTTRSLWEEGSVAVPPVFNAVPGRDGRLYVPYGIGQTIAALPLYALGEAVRHALARNGMGDWSAALAGPSVQVGDTRWGGDVEIFFVNLLHCFTTALLCAVFFLFSLRIGASVRAALTAALLLAFTSYIAPFATGFFQHPAEALFLLLAFYFLVGDRECPSWRLRAAAGLALGLAFLIRPQSALGFPPLCLYLAWCVWQRLRDQPDAALRRSLMLEFAPFVLPLAACAALQAYVNFLKFGGFSLVGGYGQPMHTFGTPLLTGLYGFLLSPGKSLFVFTPLLVLAPWTFAALWKRRRAETLVIVFIAATYLVFYSKYRYWHGGWSFGPRYVAALVPFLMLPLAPWLQTAGRKGRLAVALLAAAGLWMQLIHVAVNFSYVHHHENYDAFQPSYGYLFIPEISPLVAHTKALFAADGRVDMWLVNIYRFFGAGWVFGVALFLLGLLAVCSWRLVLSFRSVEAAEPAETSTGSATPIATARRRRDMTSIAGRLSGPVLLLVALAFNAVLLAPELRAGRVNLNDNVLHLAASERLGDSIARGEPFLDPWVSEWSLGYPVWRSYQPLPHLLGAAVLRLTEPFAAHAAAWAALVYALHVLLPLSVYGGARLLGISPGAAGLASLLVLMPSSWGEYGRFGLSYGATTWRGSGVYTQLAALLFLVPTFGLVARALDTGRRRALAAVFLALTALSHIVFGYVAFASAGVLALVGPAGERSRRLVRLVTIVAPALLLLAWFVVPLSLTSGEVNHSRWEDVRKWDSYGAAVILWDLFTGHLLDAGRLPWLSFLSALGVLAAIFSVREQLARRLLALAAFWLALFLGRATWGQLLLLAAVPADLHLHRLQATFELALLLLAAWGIERAVRAAAHRDLRLAFVAVAGVAALLIPVGRERARYLADNQAWGEENLKAFDVERGDLEGALAEAHAILAERPGRASAGLAGGWGRDFKVGSVPFYAFLTREHIDQASFLYHSMSITSEIMTLRNDEDAAHNVALGIRVLVAPADRPMPSHLRRRGTFGRFAVYEASPEGYFGLVDIGALYTGPPETWYEPNAAWLAGSYLRSGIVLALDPTTPNLPAVPAVGRWEAFPPPDPALYEARGSIVEETKDGETYRARLKLVRPCHAFVKITWFPDLVATVDGAPAQVVRVTPGFAAVPVPAGEHEVVVRYVPGALKPVLLVAGIVLCGVWFAFLHLAATERAEDKWTAQLGAVGERLATPRVGAAAALLLFTLLAVRPLFRGRLIDGHDSTVYPPRLVEMGRALADGHLPPIWAPDLGNGYGQPLFEFAPPLLYIAALFLRALGLGLANSLQLALAVLNLAGAIAVYRLGRRASVSREAALASATAWLFAPYLALDLFVRGAMAEAAGVALAPLALLGVLAATDRPSPVSIALGGLAVSLVILSHNVVSFLLLPVLAAVVLASGAARDRPLRRVLAGAAALGTALGLTAYLWLPAARESSYVKMDLLREGLLQWTEHIVSPLQLLWSPWGFGLSVPGPGDGMSFAIGPLHLLIGAAGFAVARRSRLPVRRAEAIVYAIAAAAGALLATTWSYPVWRRIETLQYFQHPWRALFLPGLFLPLLGAFAFDRAGRYPRRVALALLVLANLSHTAVKQYLTFDDEFYEPDSIARKGINTTTREEYEPRWVAARPPYSERKLSGPIEIREQSLRTARQEFQVHAPGAASVEAATFYYPGWAVEVDGEKVPVEPVPVRGTISFALPEGEHRIVLQLGRTNVRSLGLGISLVTIVLVIAALAASRLRSTPISVGSKDVEAKTSGNPQAGYRGNAGPC